MKPGVFESMNTSSKRWACRKALLMSSRRSDQPFGSARLRMWLNISWKSSISCGSFVHKSYFVANLGPWVA